MPSYYRPLRVDKVFKGVMEHACDSLLHRCDVVDPQIDGPAPLTVPFLGIRVNFFDDFDVACFDHGEISLALARYMRTTGQLYRRPKRPLFTWPLMRTGRSPAKYRVLSASLESLRDFRTRGFILMVLKLPRDRQESAYCRDLIAACRTFLREHRRRRRWLR